MKKRPSKIIKIGKRVEEHMKLFYLSLGIIVIGLSLLLYIIVPLVSVTLVSPEYSYPEDLRLHPGITVSMARVEIG